MNSQNSVPSSANEMFESDNKKAEEYINNNQLSDAAAILIKVVEKDPNNWRAYNDLGIISWMQKAYNDAYVMFRKSVSLKLDYTDAIMNLFDAALKLRCINDIVEVLKKALEINPQLDEIKVLLESIENQGDDIYTSERAMIVGAHNPIVEEGNKLLEEGKINEAMAKFLESNDNQGPNAEAYCGLGIVSYYQQRYLDAFSLFYESIKLNPADADTYVNLLDAAKNCNRVEEAKKIYKAYSKEIPSLKSVEKEYEDAI